MSTKSNVTLLSDNTFVEVYKSPVRLLSSVMHHHAYWEVLYYVEGVGRLCLEQGQSISFQPGKVICVPPGVSHGSASDTGYLVDICVVDPAFPLAHLSSGQCLSTQDNFNRDLQHLFSMLYHAHVDNSAGRKQYIRHLLTCIYDILGELLSEPRTYLEGVDAVKQRIQARYTEADYTAAQAISESGYSQNYMRKQFLMQCGITPAQYMTDLRLGHARWLLSAYTQNISIAEVALNSGYTDPLYFSKVFRKRFQLSPSQFIACIEKDVKAASAREEGLSRE